jgi:hypothetical protein
MMRRLAACCLSGLIGSVGLAQEANLAEQFMDSLTHTPPVRESMLYFVFRDLWRVTSVQLTAAEREYLRQLSFQVDAEAVRRESERPAYRRVCQAVDQNADAISLGVMLNGIQEAQEAGLQLAYSPLYEQLPSGLKEVVDNYLDEMIANSIGGLSIDYARTARMNPHAIEEGARFACERYREAVASEPLIVHRTRENWN